MDMVTTEMSMQPMLASQSTRNQCFLLNINCQDKEQDHKVNNHA